MRRASFLLLCLAGTLSFAAACKDKTIEDGDDGGDGGGSGGGSGGGDGGGDGGGNGGGGGSGDSCGDTPADACEIELAEWPYKWDYDLSYITDEEIGEPGDRDWFALEVEEGAAITVCTLAYYYDEDGEPDTVLRLYDEDGELLATNDDMPFRYYETDSGLFWQATYSGTYYLEVMDWSDWSPESSAADGGSSFDYELHGWQIGVTEVEYNDTQEEVDALIEAKGSAWYQYVVNPFSTYSIDFYGWMDSAGDVDIYPITFSAKSDGSYYMWSLWPTYYGDFAPTMALYDADWNLLAWTDNAVYGVDLYATDYAYNAFLYDVGITYQIEGDALYYLVVEDAAGGSGPGTFYPGTFLGWLNSLSQPEEEINDRPGQGVQLEMTESSSTEGWYYARFNGNLGQDDAADSFTILGDDVGGLGGKYLTVTMMNEAYGSLLDAALTIYDDDGETILTTASDNGVNDLVDPAVFDLELPDSDAVYIVVEADESSEYDGANNYFGFVAVTPDPEY